ncbi:MAG: PAS domain S-box protein [Methanoregulaceae archaeon]|nr:PAS domain S-box protein [Methanoregulaceae archaeon]
MMQDYQQEFSAIKELLVRNPGGMSVTDISKALNKNKNTVGRYLDILLISGQVDMRTYGMAKVFTLSQRVPLSRMISCAKELIMVLDEELRITEINENFLALLNLPRGYTIGKKIPFLNPPDADVHELLDILAGPRDGKGHTITFHLRSAGERIFSWKSIPTVFEDGGRGQTVVLDDITEHVLAEREIRESEERFRMMAENIRDGLVIMENETCVFSNRRIVEISGYSFEELQKIDPISLVDTEDRAELLKQLQFKEAPAREPEEIAVWMTRKDGGRRFVYCRVSHAVSREKLLTFIVISDITDLKIKDEALRESERRFRIMADNIHDGLIIIENTKIVYTNNRMAEITGYRSDELARVNLMDLVSSGKGPGGKGGEGFPKDDRKKFLQILKDARPGSDIPVEATIWITRKDGRLRCIQMSVTASEHDGMVSIYITATDITAFAERENALRDHIVSLQELLS